MCNCGKKRTGLQQQVVSSNKTTGSVVSSTSQNNASVLFQYTGNSALTITGRTTRRTYRFKSNGDKQFIDHNDAAAMMAIPVLKKVI